MDAAIRFESRIEQHSVAASGRPTVLVRRIHVDAELRLWEQRRPS